MGARGVLSDELKALRTALDALDRRLVDLLVERIEVVSRVARYKAETGKKVRDPGRERELTDRLAALATQAGLDPHFVTRIVREILEHSVRLQEELITAELHPKRKAKGSLVVGYQGGEGAYSHMAAQRHFGARTPSLVCEGFCDFRGMLEEVKSGYLDYAILPIENSIAGSINESYDLLASMDLFLVGEEIQPVEHCLIALDDVPLTHIRRVYSHPVALAQCGQFLRGLADCHIEAYADTALAVLKVREDQDPSQAAIASEEAASLYGLPVIRRDIADQAENYTRMVIVAREPETYDKRIPCRTSLIFATRHEQGALYRCIEVLARQGLNLTKLESRPKPGTAFEYLFYVDFEGNVADEPVSRALEALGAQTEFVRVLGSYPRRTEPGPSPS